MKWKTLKNYYFPLIMEEIEQVRNDYMELVQNIQQYQKEIDKKNFYSLRSDIEKRIIEIDEFIEDNFDKEYVLEFEKGKIKLKKILMINFKEKLDNNTFDKNFKNLNFDLKEIKKKSDLKEKNEKNKIPIYCEVNQTDRKLFKIIEKNNKLINKNKRSHSKNIHKNLDNINYHIKFKDDNNINNKKSINLIDINKKKKIKKKETFTQQALKKANNPVYKHLSSNLNSFIQINKSKKEQDLLKNNLEIKNIIKNNDNKKINNNLLKKNSINYKIDEDNLNNNVKKITNKKMSNKNLDIIEELLTNEVNNNTTLKNKDINIDENKQNNSINENINTNTDNINNKNDDDFLESSEELIDLIKKTDSKKDSFIKNNNDNNNKNNINNNYNNYTNSQKINNINTNYNTFSLKKVINSNNNINNNNVNFFGEEEEEEFILDKKIENAFIKLILTTKEYELLLKERNKKIELELFTNNSNYNI